MTDPTARQQLEQLYQQPPGGPIRNCRSCAHCVPDSRAEFDQCLISSGYCDLTKRYRNGCDYSLRSWAPRPWYKPVLPLPLGTFGSLALLFFLLGLMWGIFIAGFLL